MPTIGRHDERDTERNWGLAGEQRYAYATNITPMRHHIAVRTFAQMAIIPRNNASEVKATASSKTARTMASSKNEKRT